MKRKLISVILGCALFGITSISVSAAEPGDYVYAGATINVRSTPDGEVIGVLPHNAQSVVLELDEFGWYKIQSGDIIGYAASQYFGDEPFADGYTVATINAEGLNVRASKSEDADILDVVENTAEVTEDYDGGQWVSVVTENDTYGYVSADHVSIDTYYPTAVKVEDIQPEPQITYEEPSYTKDTYYYEEPVYADQPVYEEPIYTEEPVYEEPTYTDDTVYEEAPVYEEETDFSYEEPVYDADEDTYYEYEEEVEDTVSSDSSLGTSIAATACNYVGCSYVWGATGPTTFDCSGLVSYVYSSHGISVPRTAADQYYSGTKIDVDTAVYTPGALIFYHNLGHVAISLGDGTVVHASGSDTGVIISDAYYSSPYGAAIYF